MSTGHNSSGNESAAEDLGKSDGSRDLVRALLLCLAAVIFVRSFLFEPFKIPSSSMLPTLAIGDHIVVSKFTFGLSLPFTKIELVKWDAPERGDVIVFLFPRDESLHYIKRVVGVPGDRVEFKGTQLLINGEAVFREEVADPSYLQSLGPSGPLSGQFYREKLGEHSHYVRYNQSNSFKQPKEPPSEVVPADSYFVVGDNRDDSYDSRSWGYVPRKNIKGKAQFVLLSLDPERPWNSLGNVRWNRCGTLIY